MTYTHIPKASVAHIESVLRLRGHPEVRVTDAAIIYIESVVDAIDKIGGTVVWNDNLPTQSMLDDLDNERLLMYDRDAKRIYQEDTNDE